LRTLRVYYDRGVKALEKLKCEDYDGSDELLNLRKAAFHNFRAADFIAVKDGYPEAILIEMRELWRRIEVLDSELLTELTQAKERMADQLVQLAGIRAKLGKFRSSDIDSNRFEKSV
jgi:hypothetical protein